MSGGWSSRRIDAALARGTWHRIAAGLYAVSDHWDRLAPWDRHHVLARTAMRVTPDAIISHTSAAALLGLPMPPVPPARATLTLLDDRRTSTDDAWRRFHRGATPPDQIWIRARTPTLVPARTVVDCVREMRPGDALAVVDAALRRGLVTEPALRAMRTHQTRWPGVAAADVLFGLADARRESWLESVSAWVFHSWALPAALPQVVVLDERRRFVGRVDAGWPGLGVVGEADGMTKYAMDPLPGDDLERTVARKVRAQTLRHERLRDLGWEVVRWGTDDVLHRPLELRARWIAARDRARPESIRGFAECSCCRRAPTYCESPTVRGLPEVGDSQ